MNTLFNDHPTVKAFLARSEVPKVSKPLDASWLRKLCLEAGADDVGFVELERADLAEERPHIERAFPRTRSLISFVVRMNRDNVRSPARSVANTEFHHAGDEVNDVARNITAGLERARIRALNPPMAFPMEADRWMTDRMWEVSHKPVAVAAGLGRMGIHRNVIHPRFGNFILLGTILLEAEISEYTRELDYNPCLECKLCVAACPVGAIGADGAFNFSACYTHNYREFMGGFADWVENIADSRDGLDYRRRVNDSESVSMWQSLGFGPNYKSAYCMAVCPAGEDVIGQYLPSKKHFADEVMRPLQAKKEPVYVVPGSDAEAHVQKRYPHKTVRHVRNSMRPRSIAALLRGMPLSFQRQAAGGLDAIYHFSFTGGEAMEATVAIRAGSIKIETGLNGSSNIHVIADAETWLGFLAKEKNLLWALLTRKIRLRGNPKWLLAFKRCFLS
ncbi:MAG: 4Fe-4S ferredoxin iron-sulfur binding protein [Pedosphaera sp.]|nr:4Fe-4S ferredoxin iron-sulfur binding protein [Pedosphaera sp.]